MTNNITISGAARLLAEQDYILVLIHHYPDGDTIGAGYSLCHALQKMGKKSAVACSHKIPERYRYISGMIEDQSFVPGYIVTTDVADTKLLGDELQQYADKIDLSIDHHASHVPFAQNTLCDGESASTSELVYQVILEMGVELDEPLAAALYTGVATDTGCFRYSNTTPGSHEIAAVLMKQNIDTAGINTAMFDTKRKSRILIERMVLDKIQFAFGDKAAFITVTMDMQKKADVTDDDLEGITALPRQIEGVLVGVTLRECENGRFKISVRTTPQIDASKICAKMGGGGHRGAAGCDLDPPLEQCLQTVMGHVGEALQQITDNN